MFGTRVAHVWDIFGTYLGHIWGTVLEGPSSEKEVGFSQMSWADALTSVGRGTRGLTHERIAFGREP